MLIADALRQMLQQILRQNRQAPLGFTLCLGRRRKQHGQIECQHLGEKMVGLLGGNQGVTVIPTGHRQHTQFAQSLYHHQLSLGALQRLGSEPGDQDVRLRPICTGEDTGRFQRLDALTQGRTTALLHHYPPGRIQYPWHLGRPGKGGRLCQLGDGIIQPYK